MSDDGPKYTFRMGDVDLDYLKENAEDNGLDASKVMRTLAEAYNQDERLQEFVNDFYADEVGSLDEFYDSEIEALDDMAREIQRQAQGLEPEKVDDNIARLLDGLYERSETAVKQAARDFGQMDPDIGVTIGIFAGKFGEDYWEEDTE